jgi:hypothetical protein
MKRRDLLKALGLLGTTLTVPTLIAKNGIIRKAEAQGFNISDSSLRNAQAIIAGEINFTRPASLPTEINIFMYGGPSELAGNLTNIAEINSSSQNAYPTNLLDTVANGGQITANGFWQNAGGAAMERMLANGDMSVYRTINRVVDDSKAHRTSIFSAQTGGLDQFAPGVGTTLAAVLKTFMPDVYDPDVAATAPIIPFASFEGDTVLFNPGDIEDLPLTLRSVSLDSNFDNPYRRLRTYQLQSDSNCTVGGTSIPCHDALDDLAERTTAATGAQFQTLSNSFAKRRELDAFFSTSLGDPNLLIPNDPASPDPLNPDPLVNFQGRFGDNLLAACVLALENQDTRYIALSTGGLGGWDDHDNAMANNRYVSRMGQLMNNIEQALILLANGTTNSPGRTDVIINVYGEFGRNVNLNNSLGWDHGNNMNLYTFGGTDPSLGRTMGQVIGSTKVIGTPGQNRLFTSPADGSVQYEPFSIAATVYKHFGVTNPEVLTKDPVEAPLGFGPIVGA